MGFGKIAIVRIRTAHLLRELGFVIYDRRRWGALVKICERVPLTRIGSQLSRGVVKISPTGGVAAPTGARPGCRWGPHHTRIRYRSRYERLGVKAMMES
jgi:hypothetical protein